MNPRVFNPLRVPKPPSSTPVWPVHASEFKHVDIEIGAGAGLHAIRYALENPDRFLIAIERTKKADRLQSRLRHHPSIKNLLALRADAILWLTHFAPYAIISRLFIFYPNPYPKSRQQNLRWHAMPFMGHLIKRMRPDGQITMTTNEHFHHTEAQHWMSEIWKLQLRSSREISKQETPRTHFEKKYLERGQNCFELVFTVNELS